MRIYTCVCADTTAGLHAPAALQRQILSQAMEGSNMQYYAYVNMITVNVL